ncbi:hypothetical protein [Halogeometricum limi]|uniref:Transcriptional regulator n=1 Tax=Halogeometricum limi TaxID=555875 RepID=A0A1I6ICQ7_9EURY|nr:hypothetical protein [Halogeometricum limi]SFR64488.1 hypothetical protein SAMN04488124_3051 [Halogeometricum limi]
MTDETGETKDSVSVTMELSGPYDEVLSKLASDDEGGSPAADFLHDVELLLDTLDRMGEGTRSSVAERLPEEMTVEYDAEAVVGLLQVLKRYDLVVLEGNTWKPGPKIER